MSKIGIKTTLYSFVLALCLRSGRPCASNHDLGTILPRPRLAIWRTGLNQLSEYVRKWLAARQRPDYPAALALLPPADNPFSSAVLLWSGGDLLLNTQTGTIGG